MTRQKVTKVIIIGLDEFLTNTCTVRRDGKNTKVEIDQILSYL